MTKILVLGAGVAGLTAAHELAERGFDVTVVEAASDVGGKARSQLIEGLPTEHGFHFFPGFYRHLPDTLSRIPVPPLTLPIQSVVDQLVESSRILLARDGESELPFNLDVRSFTDAIAVARAFSRLGLSAPEVALAVRKLVALGMALVQGDDDTFDDVTWWDYIEADSQSKTYQKYFGDLAVRWTVAMNPRQASARTIGRIALQFWRIAAEATVAATDESIVPLGRVLNDQTNEAWFKHWVAHLRANLKVDFKHQTVTEIVVDDGAVTEVVTDKGKFTSAAGDFDYCISTLPIDALRTIAQKSPDLRIAEPAVRNLDDLKFSEDWMVGVQFFLDRDVPVAPGGITLRDAPWALTAVSQVQFWKTKSFTWTNPAGGGDILRPTWVTKPAPGPEVKGVLSVIISDWTERGHFQNKVAKSCSPGELGREVWFELKAHLNNQPRRSGEGRAFVLKDEHLIAWYPSIKYDGKRWQNDQRLFINTIGSRPKRPKTITDIRNFFFAGDFVQTSTDLASMEAANESGRRAVNAILDDGKSSAKRCEIWPLEFGVSSLGAAGVRRGVAVASNVGGRVLSETATLWRAIKQSRGWQ